MSSNAGVMRREDAGGIEALLDAAHQPARPARLAGPTRSRAPRAGRRAPRTAMAPARLRRRSTAAAISRRRAILEPHVGDPERGAADDPATEPRGRREQVGRAASGGRTRGPRCPPRERWPARWSSQTASSSSTRAVVKPSARIRSSGRRGLVLRRGTRRSARGGRRRPPPKRTSRPSCSSGACERAAAARARSGRVGRRPDGGDRPLGERVQADRQLHDHAERSERAGEQLGQVVAGHVLDHLPAGARDGAVGERDGHADHEVAGGAVARAQRAGVRGCHDAADRGCLSGPERRVERKPLTGRRRSAAARLRSGTPASSTAVRSPALCSTIRSRPRVPSSLTGSGRGGPQSSLVPPPTGRTVPPRASAAASSSREPGASIRTARRCPPAREGACGTGPGTSPHKPRGWHDLAGVGETVGIEGAAEALERVEVRLAEHVRHVALLVDADSVLAGDRPALVDACAHDQPRELLRPLGLPGHAAVVADERMQVSVARVKHVGHSQPVLGRQLLDPAQHLGQPGARDHAVLHVVVRRDAPHGGEGGLARAPDQVALGLVAGDANARRALVLADRHHLLEASAAFGRRAVELDHQRGAGVERVAGPDRRLRRAGSRGCPSSRSQRARCRGPRPARRPPRPARSSRRTPPACAPTPASAPRAGRSASPPRGCPPNPRRSRGGRSRGGRAPCLPAARPRRPAGPPRGR